MKKWMIPLIVLILCLSCTAAGAAGLATITRPADGSYVMTGDIPLWLSFVYVGGTARELAAKLMPTTIMLRDGAGTLLDYKEIQKTGMIYFTQEGGYFTKLHISEPGVYTIQVVCPGSPNQYDSVTFTVTDTYAPDPDDGVGREWSKANPGYSIQMEQDEYTIDLAKDNRILMHFTAKDTSKIDHNWFCGFADWISEKTKKVIKYKAIGENPWVDHEGYRSVDDGWIMYRALDVGDVDFYYYILCDGTYYDEHITKIHIIDSAGEGAQLKRLTLPEDLTVIEEEAFMGDLSFDEVFVPDGCTSIASRAFADCTFMDTIYIPESVTFIAEDAFEGINSLRIYCRAGSYAEAYAENRFRCTPYE